MSRIGSFLLGPEALLAAFGALVFTFCARHNSYSDQDVRTLEKLLWMLPILIVPIGFASILVPGAKNWMWLSRVNLAVVICLSLCAYRVVSGFGAPGSGPKGQDVGMILVITLGVASSALANVVCGTMVLRAQRPAADEWFRLHPIGGTALAAVSAVPIVIVQIIVTVFVLGVLAAIVNALERAR
jgi:hypothetical protein